MATSINRTQFRIDGIIDPYRTVLENLDDLFTCAGAWLSNDVTTGKWSVIINQPTEPTWFFDDRNIVGSVAVSSTGIKEYYNRVNVEFESPQWPGVKDNVVVEIPVEQRNPNEFENTLEMSLPLVNSATMARILGELELKQTRVDFIIQFQTDWNYAGIKPGEVFTITNPAMGFVDKKFRCITIEESDDEDGLLYTITGLEYDELVYERGGLFRPNRERAEDPLRYNNEVIRLIDDEETARRTVVGLPPKGIPGDKIDIPDLIDQPDFGIVRDRLDDLDDELDELNTVILPELQAKFPITEVDIANDAITAPKIFANAIVAGKIATDAVLTNNLAAGAVTADKCTINELSALTANLGLIRSGAIISQSEDSSEYVIINDDESFLQAGTDSRVVFRIGKAGQSSFVDGSFLSSASVQGSALSQNAIETIIGALGSSAPDTGGIRSITQVIASGTYNLNTFTSNESPVELRFNYGGQFSYPFIPSGQPNPVPPTVRVQIIRNSTQIFDQTYTGSASFQEPQPNGVFWEVNMPAISINTTDNNAPSGTVGYSVIVTVSNWNTQFYGNLQSEFTFRSSQIATGGGGGGGPTQAKFFFNPMDYGAVGNGVDNDAAALNAAITDASTSRGVVWIPNNTTFAVNQSILLPDNTTIMGASKFTSKIMPTADAPEGIKVLRNENFATGNENISIYNLHVDGLDLGFNNEFDGSVCIEIVRGTNIDIKNVQITRGGIEGIYLGLCNDIILSDVYAHNNGPFASEVSYLGDASGIHLDACSNFTVNGAICHTNGFHGIICSDSRNGIVDVVAYDNGFQGVFTQFDCNDINFNVNVYDNFRGAYFIDSRDITVSGTIRNCVNGLLTRDANVLAHGVRSYGHDENDVYLVGGSDQVDWFACTPVTPVWFKEESQTVLRISQITTL